MGETRAIELERADADALTRLRRWTSGRLGGLTAFLVYLLGAVILTIGAWSDPRSGWAGNCCDQQQAIWYLGWTPHALANGLNPFFTTQIGAPDGVNLMWNTPMTLLGLLGWLPAKIGGPIFGFNVLMVVGIAVSGFTAWLAIRRWTGDGLGPMVGGAVYAFSPYIASHAALHLNLATAWVPPLFLLVIDELLVTRRRPPWQAGVALGVLGATQLLINEETLATSVVAAVVLVCVLAVARRDGRVRARCRRGVARLFPALAVATMTFLVLAAWPLAVQFFGPQRINGPVQDPKTYSTDLLNLVLPTPYQLLAPDAATRVSREFSGLYHEATGYLGPPLLVLLVVVAVRRWDDLRVRVASITGALLFVLSLGPWLHIGNKALPVPLPWLPFGKLPLLQHVLPGRFTLFAWLAVAVIVAIVTARATRLAPRSAARWLLTVVATLVLILPAPLQRQPSYTPAFFRTWASHNIGPDETVLVAPYILNGGQAAPMLWAAQADYGLRMPQAYAYMPQPDGGTNSGPPATRLSKIMLAIQQGETSLVARGEARAQVAATLRFTGVRHVIVGPMPAWQAMIAFFTDLFGRPPDRVGEIAIWRDVNVRGVVAPPTSP
ncbi:hypothetical protein H7H78_19200 [Mycobacterium shinjukuense]|uniref:Glycosyl transferase n=1 Tax=Mycobacterium shinjukuense TaxID=398694 RepID=A0A7I7MP11_9MYCO|nr:hypothetical protein [Mycobacterium shinjukuense]MCV6987454.1 hypothetical protein [Mycobacterium shinjukuense]ORB66638.1 hypothetical protein BST45_13370 [Mycobacterium shinjukuense]BBX73039.1 glycosyl transferase [Mycobacterium shinjukuense]